MFPATTRWIYAAEGFRAYLGEHGLSSLEALSSPSLGEVVTTARSSWVRRWETRTNVYFVKTYDYPTLRDRVRGALRNTWFARSRAHRELLALFWLAQQGFEAPRPAAVLEARRLGSLHRAVLVTEAWPGTSLDQLLPTMDHPEPLLRALREFVATLHDKGFRDGNLDLRNVLARPEGDGWCFAKIDSPKFRVVHAGTTGDVWQVRDLDRLDADLARLGLAMPTG